MHIFSFHRIWSELRSKVKRLPSKNELELTASGASERNELIKDWRRLALVKCPILPSTASTPHEPASLGGSPGDG
jgi:hypothetical protein